MTKKNEEILFTIEKEARQVVQSAFLLPSTKDQDKFRKLFNGANGTDGDEMLTITVTRTQKSQ